VGTTEARFEIGHEEKHVIKVFASAWTSKVSIMIDGYEAAHAYQIGTSDRVYKFNIGDKEKHEVEIKVGGLVTPRVELFVDRRFSGPRAVAETAERNDMTDEQDLKYVIWKPRWQGPLFGVLKSMTYRQWLLFVVVTSLGYLGVGIILNELWGWREGIAVVILWFIALSLLWRSGRQGAKEQRP